MATEIIFTIIQEIQPTQTEIQFMIVQEIEQPKTDTNIVRIR